VSDAPPLTLEELTLEELSRLRLRAADLPPDLAAALKSRGGRPKAVVKRVPISLRVEPEVLAAFKAMGPGWPTRMNEALAEAARRLTAV
jgi:uncharacterized protein (DUF4415 family)